MWHELRQELRIGLRGLWRAPVLALTVILTVGLGIGSTTVIFSALYTALFRPLPYADPGHLVRVYTDSPPNRFRLSVADYLALSEQQTSFVRVAGYTDRQMPFVNGTLAERVTTRSVTWTYFSVLGIAPEAGRDFDEMDARPGAPPAAIVSFAFWQRRLGGRHDAVGQPIRLDGSDHMLVGVLPSPAGPLEQRIDIFTIGQWTPPSRRGPFLIGVVGRLRADVDRETASQELRTINKRIFPLWKSSYQDERATWSMTDLKTFIAGDVRTVAGVSLTAVALVWLMACANAANLLIARISSRRRELAVRTALGASRKRVVRHLLVESFLLAAGSATIGVIVASAGVTLLRSVGPAYFPRTQEVGIDGMMWQVLLTLTAASVLLFGLIPALHGSNGPLDESLRTASKSTGGTAGRRLRRLLVGTQFAVATPLIVVAALLIMSLNQLARVDLGFDTRNILTGSLQLPISSYPEPSQVRSFWDELRRRVEGIPGVADTAFSDGRPPNDVGNFNNFDLEDLPTPAGGSQPVTPWVSVSPEYFRLLRLSLIDGRLLDERDGVADYTESVVVDRAWARRFFPNQSAVGKRFKEGGCTECPWTTVVGVVSEVKYAGLDKPDDGTVYWALRPDTRTRYLAVRTSTPVERVLPAVQQIVRELDPALPLSSIATIDDLIANSLQRPRSLSLLVGSFAAVALALSIIGIYGVMSYYVQQSTKDIGIRIALGGRPADMVRAVVRQGLKIVASGVGIGIGLAIAAGQLLSTAFFGVGSMDAGAYVLTAAVLVFAAMVACYVPARRAARVEPAIVLKSD